MLSGLQLDEVKAKIEGGRTLQDVVNNDYSGNKAGAVRRQLVERFTPQVVNLILMDARLSNLTVEELNARISQIQSRLDKVTAIRDAKL